MDCKMCLCNSVLDPSGVAVLSCTDCSGSSTSSDITDPGSPFSIASSHSEDSASQSAKMPPTQSAHHPPWSWTEENNPPLKRPTQEKVAFTKRLKTETEENKQSPTCLISNVNKSTQVAATNLPNNIVINNNKSKSINTAQMPTKNAANEMSNRNEPSPNNNHNNNNNNTKLNGKLVNNKSSNKAITTTPAKKSEIVIAPRIMQQGKITEYFKSQIKANGIKKELSNIALKTNPLEKFVTIVDSSVKHQKITSKSVNTRKAEVRNVNGNSNLKKIAASPVKNRKPSPISVPRKILPAPSKIPEKITVNNVGINNFHPVTLTAVTFPPNLTYIHTKTPKPPDTNIFVPHFAAITSDKINTIPIVNRTPSLNFIQPIQKFTTINNFNSCVKLNATVVPIVKLNTLPSRLNGSNFNVLSVETASPTVLSAKPAVTITTTNATGIAPKQQQANSTTSPPTANCNSSNNINNNGNSSSSSSNSSTTSDPILGICRNDEPATPDSDSGISSTKDVLEVSVNETITDEPQKSPILSQPKTIRFPAKPENSDTKEKSSHTNDSTACQWAKCHALFDTSGALLEHLQIEHVISQATQEQYVCLWLGCKVHGRTSCSRSWLERHVLAHAGTKPFRCIVDGCGMRFNSQVSLERHVNNHFNTDSTQNGNNKKAVENGSAKLFKRNGKKIRFRRQPWSARMFDFIDSGIMEGLQYRLLTMSEKRTAGQFESVAGDAVTIHSQILARRIEPDGSKKLLLRWHPKDM
ncbi:hypothetical protein AMK59_342 [Oryctes borbonicus]|uniref:C2H2-type domain-containing protein n=1 Tax=Oryctes borbonicus TaxID=1629725 RepID=A0A0T6BBP5_9SCAR|nr:hypothetical protein AMK59_342 [Oryctes borbonicus]